MRRLLLLAVITVTALPTLLSATSKSYDVVPYSNCVAQTTIAYTDVIQYYRNTLDSIKMVSFWVGDKGDGEPFNVQVKDSATEQIIAASADTAPTRSWAWLNMPVSPYQGRKPVRGRTYKVIVSRPLGAGAISFAYDPRNPKSV